MHTIIIIPGKNWLLSLAEFVAFLEKKKLKFKIESFSKEFFIVKFEGKINPLIIDDLGGVIKIGEINTSFQTDFLRKVILNKDKISKNEIGNIISEKTKLVDNLASSKKRFFFGVSVYCSEKKLCKKTKATQRFFGSLIKKKLTEQGKKSRFMGFSRDRRLPQLSHVEVIKKRLIESNGEFIICIDENQTFLSTTKAVHNPFEFQKRDIEKPIQRKIFGMPPRLARILVNLSLSNQNSMFLDPFCGVGSILQEALLIRSKVIGVDINPWCIKASERNLEWISNNYQIEKPDFRVIQGDIQRLSKKIGSEEIDCVATEPDLGPALRQIPTNPYAQKIINKLNGLYKTFLQESYKVLKKNGRCVFVTPYFRTRSGKTITMNIDEKAKIVGFTRIFPFNKEVFEKTRIKKDELWKISSLIETSKRHKTGREIHILQK